MNVLTHVAYTAPYIVCIYVCTLYKVHYPELNCLCSLVYEFQANDAIKPYTIEVFVSFVAFLTSFLSSFFDLLDVLKNMYIKYMYYTIYLYIHLHIFQKQEVLGSCGFHGCGFLVSKDSCKLWPMQLFPYASKGGCDQN